MTWEEVQKAKDDGTWLVWKAVMAPYLVQLDHYIPNRHYAYRKRHCSDDAYPIRCAICDLRLATAKDLMKLDLPPLDLAGVRGRAAVTIRTVKCITE